MLSRETAEKALSLIKKGTTQYEFFFSKLTSPEWIPYLREKDYLTSPQPIIHEGKYLQFPFWIESQYLARVASKDPALVLSVMKDLCQKTDNPRVHSDFNKAASTMPVEFAKEWAALEAKWIDSQEYIYFLSEELIALVGNLLNNNCINESRILLKSALRLCKSGENKESNIFLQGKKYHPKIEIYEYEEILKKCIPVLTEKNYREAIELLCDLLETAFKISGDNEDELSVVWQPAIEDHEQNKYRDNIENKLIECLRDAAVKAIPRGRNNVLSLIEQRNYKTLLRVSLYLRTLFPEIDPSGNSRIVLEKGNLKSLALHHELYNFLQKNFNNLSDAAKQSYIDYAYEEENKEDFEKWYKERFNKELSEEEFKSHIRRNRYSRLYPIQAYLVGETLIDFQLLKSEFKELDHPDFLSYSSGITYGPTSPKKADELSKMSIDEIINFLTEWKSGDDIFGDSAEGLGRVLCAVVKDNPRKFSSRAFDFRVLDPTYVREIVFGLRESLKENKEFQWNSILQLCEWVVSQDVNIQGRKVIQHEMDPGWQWTRNEIAHLLTDVLRRTESKNGIAISEKGRVWKILLSLANDAEPTPQYEAEYGSSSMDPLTVSINTTRGNAFHAVISYCWWIYDHVKATNQNIPFSFNEFPELKELLESHLNPKKDSSLAIRSVYGQHLPELVYFDKEWVSKKLDSIFPKNESMARLYHAAWDTYLTYCKPNKDLFELLLKEYHYAVEHFSQKKERQFRQLSPRENLVEHVTLFYLWGLINANDEDSILKLLISNSDPEMRKHLLRFIGRGLYFEGSEMTSDMISRAKKLFEMRLTALRECKISEELKEFEAFDLWFGAETLDGDWVLNNLLGILKHDNDFLFDYRLTERMEELVQDKPLLTLNCLEQLIHHDKRDWFSFDYQGHVKKTLAIAIGNIEPHVSEYAKRLVQLLGAKGYLSYGELLK